MERELSGLLIKKWYILMVKSKQPFSGYGKNVLFSNLSPGTAGST